MFHQWVHRAVSVRRCQVVAEPGQHLLHDALRAEHQPLPGGAPERGGHICPEAVRQLVHQPAAEGSTEASHGFLGWLSRGPSEELQWEEPLFHALGRVVDMEVRMDHFSQRFGH